MSLYTSLCVQKPVDMESESKYKQEKNRPTVLNRRSRAGTISSVHIIIRILTSVFGHAIPLV